jgi:hypothetical protein
VAIRAVRVNGAVAVVELVEANSSRRRWRRDEVFVVFGGLDADNVWRFSWIEPYDSEDAPDP